MYFFLKKKIVKLATTIMRRWKKYLYLVENFEVYILLQLIKR